ncbi:MAG: hypothetical protein ABSF43_16865 [Rectinemataceae bacterium]
MNRVVLCCLLLGIAGIGARGQSAAQFPQGDPMPNRNLSSLFGFQRQISYDVSDYRGPDGKAWIHMTSRCETAIRAPMEAIIAKLWDFTGAPRVFQRIDAIHVRSDTGTMAVTEQRTVVRVLGISFVSNLVFRNTMTRQGQKAATVSFEMIESDGSCLSSKGAWELEDCSDKKGPSTYVQYSLDSYIEPRFPGQAFFLRDFGSNDMKGMVRELTQAMGPS